MECHEGATMIKTFRGLMADDTQDTIVLHTNNGEMGYRIVKFQAIPKKPMTLDQENVVKIYKVQQTTVDGDVDFSDQTLLAVCCVSWDNDSATPGIGEAIIFDQEIFNQDIYITHEDVASGARDCNYYLELEQVKLDLNESTVATLKDVRNKGIRTLTT